MTNQFALRFLCCTAILSLLPALARGDEKADAARAATLPTATTAPATRPTTTPSADYQVIDWSVFVAEPTVARANAKDSFKSTFPSFVLSRRSNADVEQRHDPMPMGVIRVIGGTVPSPKFDVLLNITSGEFESQWPRAESRSNRLLWSNLTASDSPPPMAQLGEKDWMNHLRDGDARYLTASGESRGERFLMYDAEPVFPVPLRIELSGDNGYKITNSGSPDLADFEIYKGKPDGWRSAHVDALKGTRVPTSHPTVVSDQPKIAVGDALKITLGVANGGRGPVTSVTVAANGSVMLPALGTTQVAGKTVDDAQTAIADTYKKRNMPFTDVTIEITSAASDKSAAAPTTLPSGPMTEIALSTSPVSDPKQLLGGWKDRLAAAGLPPGDVEMILSILAKYAIDPGRLTAVYRLSSTQMDDLLPMDIVPTPAKITRVGIVVIRNIDPAINLEIDQLVKELGDDDWSKRESAQKKLTDFGRAAKSAVEKSSHSKDMEVVWRSEAILQTIDPKPLPPPQ